MLFGSSRDSKQEKARRDDPHWALIDDLEERIVGAPARTAAGAYAAMQALAAQDCQTATDVWLAAAVTDYLRARA